MYLIVMSFITSKLTFSVENITKLILNAGMNVFMV